MVFLWLFGRIKVHNLLSENASTAMNLIWNCGRLWLIENIEKEMRKVFQVDDSKEVRLWNKYMSNTYEHLGKPDNTVQDAGLFQGQVWQILSR